MVSYNSKKYEKEILDTLEDKSIHDLGILLHRVYFEYFEKEAPILIRVEILRKKRILKLKRILKNENI